MRTHGICLGSLLLLAGMCTTPAMAGDSIAEAEKHFGPFCEAWMRQLADREVRNLRNIRWQQRGSEVEGVYIGYGGDHTCHVKTSQPTGVPVGKLVYREFRYRKHGANGGAASASGSEVVDVTEITEIFRWAGSEWVY